MPSPDALRASLDNREVDRKAGRDREYVESVLRRIGDAPHGAVADEKPAKIKDTAAGKKTPDAKSNGSVADDTPAFGRVIPVAHPRDERDEVVFREITKPAPTKDREVWSDLTEGEDPDRRPDPKAGYVKGNYALFRRQIDDDHAVYFFATELQDDAEQARVPTGYEVRSTEETNLPYIAKRGKAVHLNQTEQVRAKDRQQALEIAARKGIGGINTEA